MNFFGKLIGAGVGFLFAGPIGLILGFFIGHLFDAGYLQRLLGGMRPHQAGHELIQRVFFNSTFKIMGYLAKSDGRVSEKEIAIAKRIMQDMGLSEEQRKNAIHQFNLGKQPDFRLERTLNELRQACIFQPNLLRTFLEVQIEIAFADGQQISPGKRAALQRIFNLLGIQGINFGQYEHQQQSSYNYQQHAQQPGYNPQQQLKEAYELLEINSDASDPEVKKAYRRLMSKNHPDKLIAQGVPPEMVKLATKKTQQIKSAYEAIKKSRGM